jgi:hypothetical protein
MSQASSILRSRIDARLALEAKSLYIYVVTGVAGSQFHRDHR